VQARTAEFAPAGALPAHADRHAADVGVAQGHRRPLPRRQPACRRVARHAADEMVGKSDLDVFPRNWPMPSAPMTGKS
jgi:hypothetical protein